MSGDPAAAPFPVRPLRQARGFLGNVQQISQRPINSTRVLEIFRNVWCKNHDIRAFRGALVILPAHALGKIVFRAHIAAGFPPLFSFHNLFFRVVPLLAH